MGVTDDIDRRLSEIKAEVKRLEKKLDDLSEEEEELERARDVIVQYLGAKEPVSERDQKTKSLTKQQLIVYNAVPIGKENCLPPSEIALSCKNLSADYVRTTLRRLLADGWVFTDSGRYWSTL